MATSLASIKSMPCATRIVPSMTWDMLTKAIEHISPRLLSSPRIVPTTLPPMTTFKLKSAAPPPPHNDILFPTLPPELRSIIYSYALASHPSTITISAADAIYNSPLRQPYYLPQLCHVNEATRIDVGLWFLRTTEFGLLYAQHIVYFAQFLSSFPDKLGFASIRRLDFQLFGRNIPEINDGVRELNTYIEFMKLCTGLTQVRIKFEMWYLPSRRRTPNYWGTTTWNPELFTVEGLVEMYHLEDLFQLKELAKIVVEVWPKTLRHMSPSRRHLTPDPWSVMEKVAEWMREGWKNRGRKVDVKLVESGCSGLRWAGGSEGGSRTGT